VIDDPATLAQIESILAPQRELGRLQGQLGERQGELGKQEEAARAAQPAMDALIERAIAYGTARPAR
jgi:hypothetical protein